MKIAVFPGSFDPITNGHIDILKRAIKLFDKIIVLVAVNPEKKTTLSLEERVETIKEATKDIPNLEIDFTSGLTVAYAKEHGATYLIRGLRNEKDFEFESELMAANKAIDSSIETVFFIADEQDIEISSSRVKELLKSGHDISKLVPKNILEKMK